MLVDVELIVGLDVLDLRIAVLSAAELRVIQADIVNRLEPISEINGKMIRQADQQACAELKGQRPIVGLHLDGEIVFNLHVRRKGANTKVGIDFRHAYTAAEIGRKGRRQGKAKP